MIVCGVIFYYILGLYWIYMKNNRSFSKTVRRCNNFFIIVFVCSSFLISYFSVDSNIDETDSTAMAALTE